MKWYGILALVFIFFALSGIVYVGMNTDKFYDYKQIVTVDVEQPLEEEITSSQIVELVEENPLETVPADDSEDILLSNKDVCLAIIGKLFTNLNPTEQELAELEKELKENNCGD